MNSAPKNTTIAAANDLGFSATKLSYGRPAQGRRLGAIVADQFSSLAPRQSGVNITLPFVNVVAAVEIEVGPNFTHLAGKGIDKPTHGICTTAVNKGR